MKAEDPLSNEDFFSKHGILSHGVGMNEEMKAKAEEVSKRLAEEYAIMTIKSLGKDTLPEKVKSITNKFLSDAKERAYKKKLELLYSQVTEAEKYSGESWQAYYERTRSEFETLTKGSVQVKVTYAKFNTRMELVPLCAGPVSIVAAFKMDAKSSSLRDTFVTVQSELVGLMSTKKKLERKNSKLFQPDTLEGYVKQIKDIRSELTKKSNQWSELSKELTIISLYDPEAEARKRLDMIIADQYWNSILFLYNKRINSYDKDVRLPMTRLTKPNKKKLKRLFKLMSKRTPVTKIIKEYEKWYKELSSEQSTLFALCFGCMRITPNPEERAQVINISKRKLAENKVTMAKLIDTLFVQINALKSVEARLIELHKHKKDQEEGADDFDDSKNEEYQKQVEKFKQASKTLDDRIMELWTRQKIAHSAWQKCFTPQLTFADMNRVIRGEMGVGDWRFLITEDDSGEKKKSSPMKLSHPYAAHTDGYEMVLLTNDAIQMFEMPSFKPIHYIDLKPYLGTLTDSNIANLTFSRNYIAFFKTNLGWKKKLPKIIKEHGEDVLEDGSKRHLYIVSRYKPFVFRADKKNKKDDKDDIVLCEYTKEVSKVTTQSPYLCLDAKFITHAFLKGNFAVLVLKDGTVINTDLAAPTRKGLSGTILFDPPEEVPMIHVRGAHYQKSRMVFWNKYNISVHADDMYSETQQHFTISAGKDGKEQVPILDAIVWKDFVIFLTGKERIVVHNLCTKKLVRVLQEGKSKIQSTTPYKALYYVNESLIYLTPLGNCVVFAFSAVDGDAKDYVETTLIEDAKKGLKKEKTSEKTTKGE